MNDQPRYILGEKLIYDYMIRMAQLQRQIDRLTQMNDRNQRKERYDQVIERYNRVHGQKKKTSLAQICAEMGVSYEAVRKYRLRTKKRKS